MTITWSFFTLAPDGSLGTERLRRASAPRPGDHSLDNDCLGNTLCRVADFYDPRNFDPHSSLGYLIGNIRRLLLEALDRELAQHDLTAAQAIVLFQLDHGEFTHAAEYCRVLQYDPGAMTRLIDRLEAKGFVTRQRTTEDRRTIKLELTAAGRTVVPRIRASAIAVFNGFLRGFSKSEARQLTEFLKRLLANGAAAAGK